MKSLSAAYFRKLARVSSEIRCLQKIVKNEAEHVRNPVEHKAELDRIYKLIKKSAADGGTHVYIPDTDPLWKNDAVKNILRDNGFDVRWDDFFENGAIDWYSAKERELD